MFSRILRFLDAPTNGNAARYEGQKGERIALAPVGRRCFAIDTSERRGKGTHATEPDCGTDRRIE
jgi:hypothetical protein